MLFDAQILPPCPSIIFLLIDKPRPVPFLILFVLLPCVKSLKIDLNSDLSIPIEHKDYKINKIRLYETANSYAEVCRD